jgi:hypothetical protein
VLLQSTNPPRKTVSTTLNEGARENRALCFGRGTPLSTSGYSATTGSSRHGLELLYIEPNQHSREFGRLRSYGVCLCPIPHGLTSQRAGFNVVMR